VVLGHERTQKSQIVKQADVVALLGLLPEEFVGDTKSANFRYYESRCSHGSSLSPAMHGLVAARLGDTAMALRFFRQTAAIDLADTHATADGGVHIAAQGGIWMLAVFGFAGLSWSDDGLSIDPRLPKEWRSLRFRVQWHRRSLLLSIDLGKQTVEAIMESGEPMVLFVGGKPNQISSAATVVIPIGSLS
jgi:trehalose/maltose hydrolase-like predicted phosphorylase